MKNIKKDLMRTVSPENDAVERNKTGISPIVTISSAKANELNPVTGIVGRTPAGKKLNEKAE